MASLTQVMARWPGHYELSDTAGVHQIYRGERFADPLGTLRAYHLGAAA
jgi:hypothetical protein